MLLVGLARIRRWPFAGLCGSCSDVPQYLQHLQLALRKFVFSERSELVHVLRRRGNWKGNEGGDDEEMIGNAGTSKGNEGGLKGKHMGLKGVVKRQRGAMSAD